MLTRLWRLNFEINLIFLIKPFFLHAQKLKIKVSITWERKEFLRWNKKHFQHFWRAIIKANKQFFGRWESDFKLYPWLDYDEVSDNVTCFACERHHSKTKRRCWKVFTSAGYSDWKRALSSFDEHQAASYHKLVMTNGVILPQYDHVKEMQNEVRWGKAIDG